MTDKKMAFITGGNRGIGLETARQLGEQGVAVIIGARDIAKGEAAAAQLREQGIDASAIPYDAEDSNSPQEVCKYFEERFGKLDILINNAGVFKEPSSGSKVADLAPDTLRATFDTNFFAVVSLTQALLPLIAKSDAGRIVNLSSVLGSLTLRSGENAPLKEAGAFAYDASKTALNSFTLHLANELAETSIKVNSAHPGWVKTEMGGAGAELEISEGGKTSAQLALLGADGPTGGYFHLGEPLPW